MLAMSPRMDLMDCTYCCCRPTASAACGCGAGSVAVSRAHLQPVHTALSLRSAMTIFFKLKNLATCAHFCRRLLELNPGQKVRRAGRRFRGRGFGFSGFAVRGFGVGWCRCLLELSPGQKTRRAGVAYI